MDGSMNVSDMPVMILIFAVTAIIAVITFAYIYNALPALSGPSNVTVSAFAANFYSGIQLLGVTLIVMAAVSIIGVVLWLRGTH